MAQSHAKRQRLKQVREGKLSPETNRGSWGGIIPVERTTPTRAERLNREQHKHKKKWNHADWKSDGSISFFHKNHFNPQAKHDIILVSKQNLV
ncbi:hypothetical protein [Paenibacillus thalictri]|uniref:Uncharacterized protein n=1 Tax=Paenibacillus thalictri TaxID=2527873 RepID=A0A4Q9DVT8_9BACL|nr:hypothetical protein [Paenibacillus thalictri]TBL81139.1 hypothetical protein EYB31_03330 [Paenibacillus thalictri]